MAAWFVVMLYRLHKATLLQEEAYDLNFIARRTKRRFHCPNPLVLSVEGLYRNRQPHEFACFVNGDCRHDFRQDADPSLHKSREPRAMPMPKVMRDDNFYGLPNCL